jgi:hypothetical protein
MQSTKFTASDIRSLRTKLREAHNDFAIAKLVITPEFEKRLEGYGSDEKTKRNAKIHSYWAQQRKKGNVWEKGDNELLSALLRVVEPILRIREDYALSYYQHFGRDDFSVMYSMPAGMEIPDISKVPMRANDRDETVPFPEGANADFMIALQGDASLKSYLFASIFRRELAELGAMWHSVSWGIESVIGSPPWLDQHLIQTAHADFERPSNEQEMRFNRQMPTEWEPIVTQRNDGIVAVQFYTHTRLGGERITGYTDRYEPGSYQHATAVEVIATGPKIMMH